MYNRAISNYIIIGGSRIFEKSKMEPFVTIFIYQKQLKLVFKYSIRQPEVVPGNVLKLHGKYLFEETNLLLENTLRNLWRDIGFMP